MAWKRSFLYLSLVVYLTFRFSPCHVPAAEPAAEPAAKRMRVIANPESEPERIDCIALNREVELFRYAMKSDFNEDFVPRGDRFLERLDMLEKSVTDEKVIAIMHRFYNIVAQLLDTFERTIVAGKMGQLDEKAAAEDFRRLKEEAKLVDSDYVKLCRSSVR
jgi:hypothetical protein